MDIVVFEREEQRVVIKGKPTYEQWEAEVKRADRDHKNALWYLGDLLAYGEDHWGEEYANAVNPDAYSVATAKLAIWVARKFPPGQRTVDLSWSHYKAAAGGESLPKRLAVLNEAKENGWTCAKVLNTITATITQQSGITQVIQENGVTLDTNTVKPEPVLDAEFTDHDAPAPQLIVDESADLNLRILAFLGYVRNFLEGDKELGECDFLLKMLSEKNTTVPSGGIINTIPEIRDREGIVKGIAPKTTKMSSPMQIPSLEECTEYGTAIGLPAKESRAFWNYQESKGWKVGIVPMKKWHSAMATWKGNWEDRRDKRLGGGIKSMADDVLAKFNELHPIP